MKERLLQALVALEWATDELDECTSRQDFHDIAMSMANLRISQLSEAEKQRYTRGFEEPIFPSEPEIPEILEEGINDGSLY